MVIPEEMEEAVYQETTHFGREGISEHGRLPCGRMQVYHDITDEDLAIRRDLLRGVIGRKGEHIGNLVYASIAVVEFSHPPVIHEQNTDFGSFKVKCLEESL